MAITGKGWHGDSKRHAEAGKKGGLATAKSRGNDFYSQIGAKGGSVSPGNFKNDPQKASLAGKKGGKK
jgi:general stress protein YciG